MQASIGNGGGGAREIEIGAVGELPGEGSTSKVGAAGAVAIGTPTPTGRGFGLTDGMWMPSAGGVLQAFFLLLSFGPSSGGVDLRFLDVNGRGWTSVVWGVGDELREGAVDICTKGVAARHGDASI